MNIDKRPIPFDPLYNPFFLFTDSGGLECRHLLFLVLSGILTSDEVVFVFSIDF